MRRFLRAGALALVLAGAALPLVNCTNDQVQKTNTVLDTADNRITNFASIYDRVGQTINLASMKLIKPHCQSAMDAGEQLKRVAAGDDKALTVLDATGQALDAFCTSPPSDIDTAAVALAKAAANAQAAVKAHGG